MPFDRPLALDLAQRICALYDRRLVANINIAATDTQVLVSRGEPGRCLVLFPGTDGWRDAITDLRAAKAKWDHGRVHAGFRVAYLSAQKSLRALLPLDEDITIAGHSLGGALAMLCADDLQMDGYGVGSVYTYGQPRTGNGPFSRSYNRRLGGRTFRCVNQHDPIPHVPWMLGTYRHAGTEVFLDAAGIHVDRPAWRQIIQPVVDVKDAPSAESIRWISADAHHITGYIARLSKSTP